MQKNEIVREPMPLDECERKYSDIIKGKRCIFVGPARTLIGKKQRAFIEGFDVVIRSNAMFPVPEVLRADYGVRCDVLYLNYFYSRLIEHGDLLEDIGNMVRLWSSAKLKMLVLKADILDKAHEYSKYVPVRVMHPGFLDKVKHKVNTAPNLAPLMIEDLLQYKPAELYLTGMDFYEAGVSQECVVDGYLDNAMKYSTKRIQDRLLWIHDQEPHKRYIENMYEAGKVDIDDKIKECIGVPVKKVKDNEEVIDEKPKSKPKTTTKKPSTKSKTTSKK